MAAEGRGVAVGVVRVADVEEVAAPTAQAEVSLTVVEVAVEAVSAITVRRTGRAIAATRLATWPRTAVSAYLPTTETMSVVVAEEEVVVALLRDPASHVMMAMSTMRGTTTMAAVADTAMIADATMVLTT
jgi:hypothetical protein